MRRNMRRFLSRRGNGRYCRCSVSSMFRSASIWICSFRRRNNGYIPTVCFSSVIHAQNYSKYNCCKHYRKENYFHRPSFFMPVGLNHLYHTGNSCLFLLPAKNKSISATVKLYYLYAYKSTIEFFKRQISCVCSASLRLEQSFRFTAPFTCATQLC